MSRDQNVAAYESMITPQELITKLPTNDSINTLVDNTRQQITDIINDNDQRKIIIVGPCSIHNPQEAIIYAKHLSDYIKSGQAAANKQLIVMRTYFEKPRTRSGWKGLVYDPHLNGSYDVNQGIWICRKLMLDILSLGVPIALEFLDTITPQYFADLVSWGAIGARTTESQVHRQLASALSMPIGFKNATSGDVNVAIDAVYSASTEHVFPGINMNGLPTVIKSNGNPDCHIILRGGKTGPNYNRKQVNSICNCLASSTINKALIIDCSHGNSGKDYAKQPIVAQNVYQQINNGNSYIKGIMIESNIYAGNQKLPENDGDLKFGVSITDSCLSWADTHSLLKTLKIKNQTEIDPNLEQLNQARQELISLELSLIKAYTDNDQPQLNELMKQRLKISTNVAQAKFNMSALPKALFKDYDLEALVNVPEVEATILTRVARLAEQFTTDTEAIKMFFQDLFTTSKHHQIAVIKSLLAKINIGYLGPEGSYSQKIASQKFSDFVNLVDFSQGKIRELAIENCHYVVLPSSNNRIGPIKDFKGLITDNNLQLVTNIGDIQVNLALFTLGKVNSKKEIKIIHSHPAAYQQVKTQITWPHRFVASTSTSQAMVDMISSDINASAICDVSLDSAMVHKQHTFYQSNTSFALFKSLKFN